MDRNSPSGPNRACALANVTHQSCKPSGGSHGRGTPEWQAGAERETRQMREKWSQDKVLIKAQILMCLYRRGGGPFPPIHSWSLEQATGDDVQDRV